MADRDDTELSLRDELLRARDQANGEDPGNGKPEGVVAEDGGAGERPASTEAHDQGNASSARSANEARQPRGERGRFAPKSVTDAAPAAEAVAATAAAADAAAASQSQPDAAAAAPIAGPLLAPTSWTSAEKAEWAKLTPGAQKAIHRREQDFHRELTKQDPERNLGRDFIKASQPFQQLIERSGKHPIAAYTDMMSIMQTMIAGTPQQKLSILQQAAARNGLDFRAVVGLPPGQGGARPPAGQPGAPPPQQSPAPMPPEIQQMAREWQEFRTTQSREAQERQTREQEQTMSEIMAFRSKPEARFFDQVRDTMIALLQTEAVQTLQEAYDQAIWARPDIRAVLETERNTAAQAQRDAAARAAAARRRGGSLRGSGGSSPAPAQADRSLRQELEAGFADARARI